ncbi:MAG: DUF2145 domain-containing protein [Pseudomonadota bacterium]
MTRKAMSLLALALGLAALAPTAALAGRSCEEKPIDATVVIKAMNLAHQTRQALDESGAEVAMIARVGQDLSKYKLRYSHMALVWRDHPKGRWTVVHELNECGTAASALYNEGLGNFFMDDMYAYETQIVLPGPAIQAGLARLLASNTPRRLHGAHYNMLAYAYSSKYQNSNQWVLEAYAAASAPAGKVETRDEAQSWLKQANYQPITIKVPTMTRLGGRMFRANIAFDDHPFDRRMAGQIDTVTVDSMVRFIKQRDAETREIVLALDDK